MLSPGLARSLRSRRPRPFPIVLSALPTRRTPSRRVGLPLLWVLLVSGRVAAPGDPLVDLNPDRCSTSRGTRTTHFFRVLVFSIQDTAVALCAYKLLTVVESDGPRVVSRYAGSWPRRWGSSCCRLRRRRRRRNAIALLPHQHIWKRDGTTRGVERFYHTRRDCRQKRRFVERFSRRLTHLHQRQSLASPTGRRRRAPLRRAAAAPDPR